MIIHPLVNLQDLIKQRLWADKPVFCNIDAQKI